MKVTYLLNSGFMIKEENILMLFDDFDDPTKIVDRVVAKGNFEKFYIFVSHAHFDHFGTHIRAYSDQATRYIFSNDIKRTRRVKMFPPDNITFVKKYNEYEFDGIKVQTFDSTDVGVSFLVETESGKKIFHAGDFNWWDWEEDTEANRFLAMKDFKRQMKKLYTLSADIAFFPVDGRLGNTQEKGVTEFAQKTDIKNLVAMHRVNYPEWKPSQNFLSTVQKDIPIWSPTEPGEYKIF